MAFDGVKTDFPATLQMRSLATTILVVLVISSRALAEFQMPDISDAKSISIYQIRNGRELKRICDWVDPATVKRVCEGIVQSEVRPGVKLFLEPGPILVVANESGEPLVAFMQKLDGWLAAFSFTRSENQWALVEALMERDEYRRPTAEYSCWDLVYRMWLHTVNPELYKAEQEGGAGEPATRSESNSEGGDKPQPESEGRSR